MKLHKVSVTTAVICILLATTTLSLAAFGWVNYSRERARLLLELHDDLERISAQLESTLSLPLWSFQHDQVGTLLESIMANNRVFGVMVEEGDPPVLVAARMRDKAWNVAASDSPIPTNDTLSASRDITYGDQIIGTVTVRLTPRFMNEALSRTRTSTVISILVLNASLALIIFLALRKVIIQPLQSVQAYARRVSSGSTGPEGICGERLLNELDSLGRSIEEMVRQVRQSEERYALAQRAANIGSWDWDVDSGTIHWSERFEPLVGYEVGGFPGTYEAFLQRVHPEDRPRLMLELRTSVKTGKDFNIEYRIELLDGGIRWLAGVGDVVSNGDDESPRVLGIVMDITQRKQAEEELDDLNRNLQHLVNERTKALRAKAEELEEANKRLRVLDEMKSSFISSVSHELRTPLTSMLGFAKLISKDFVTTFRSFLDDRPELRKKGERIQANLEIIEHEGQRLTRLINDVLDLNKIEAGRMDWHDRSVQPADVISAAVEAVRGEFSAKPEVALRLDLPEALPTVHVDPDKLQQVLLNLLSNAAKFTTEGQVTVNAGVTDGGLRVTVRDTGVGVPEDYRDIIFDKFKQVHDDTLQHKPAGTGLGLTICKQIVEHYGGRIWVQPAPGQGSEFIFTLPFPFPAEQPSDDFDAGQAAIRPLILVVDDDNAVRVLLSQILRQEGYGAITAVDGRDALDKARRYRPELITMDMVMPGMDGRAAISALRRDADLSAIPILVITVLSGNDLAGEDATLRKPVEQSSLVDAVGSLLRNAPGRHEVLVLRRNGPEELSAFLALDVGQTQFCAEQELWARIEAGFRGTVVIPSWAEGLVDIQRLCGRPGMQVLILPPP